jgi:hypothetical protein
MAISAGDRVRAYNSPTAVCEVVETGVERDVEVEDAETIWRLPSGDTLLRNTRRDGVYLVVAERLVHAVD